MDEATPTAQQATPPRRTRQRPPKSADARARGMAARKLQRSLEALKATKDAAKLEQAAALVARLNGAEEQQESAKAAPPTQAAPAESAAPAEPVRGTPAGVNPRGPAWPSEAAIAEFTPLVRQGVEQLAVVLRGTRFALDEATRVQVGEQVVTRSKVDTLSEGLAPLAAKYLPSSLNTPEAVAVAALLAVFGAPLVQLALERRNPTQAAASGAQA